MNVENLSNNYPQLLSHMEDSGYSKSYIYSFRREIQWIIAEAGLRNWDCYGDVYRDYQTNLSSGDKLEKKHAIIGAIEQFDLHGRYPDSKWHSPESVTRSSQMGTDPWSQADFGDNETAPIG